MIGWKIGLTSKAMQYALDIDIPDGSILFDDMLFESGGEVPAVDLFNRASKLKLHLS